MAAHIKQDRVKETSTTTGTGTFTLGGAVTGFRSFGSVMATGDTCFYCIEDGTNWEVGIGTYTTSGTTLSRDTILESSNAGAAVSWGAGTKNVFITEPSERFKLPEMTTDPGAPASGVLLYSKAIAGRHIPRYIGPSGLDSALQPAFWANNITMWLPATGTTASINFGISFTVATTQATPAIANTNFMTQIRRATFTTTTTAANTTGVRTAAAVAWRGNAAGLGGFFFAATWGILTYTSTMRAWCGLSGLTTAINGDPSAQNDTVCMSKDTGETTWQVLTRDTSAASKTSTGRTTAAAGTGEVFAFYAFCKPNDSKITVRVVDISSGTVLVDNVDKSSNLPTNTTMLTAHCEAQNQAGGAGSAVAIFLNKLYIETDN
jgi:hypothetical protein